MRLSKFYSHLNGYEYLLVRKPKIWKEIVEVIESVQANDCKTKISREKTKKGKILYNPTCLNNLFKNEFNKRGWNEKKIWYILNDEYHIARELLPRKFEEQKKIIEEYKKTNKNIFNIKAYKQIDFFKDRVAVEVQFGKYAFVAYDIFVKHLAFYFGNEIDVGIEIIPIHDLKADMSTGIAYYESEVNNIWRHGRNVPAVPLVIIGVDK